MSNEYPLNIEAIIKEISLNDRNKYNNNQNNESEKSENFNDSEEEVEDNGCRKELNLVNGFRIVLICICLIWFLYNSYVIIHKYLLFDTIITLSLEPPDVADLPGLTICGPYIISPITLRYLYPEYNYSTEIAETDQSDDQQDIIKRNIFNKFEQKAFKTYLANEIMKIHSLKPEDLITKCIYNPINLRHDSGSLGSRLESINCTEIASIVESIYEGRKCFTFFSRMGNFNSKHSGLKMSYDMNPSIEVTVRMDDNLWSLGSNEEKVIMTVHPPDIIRKIFYFFPFPDYQTPNQSFFTLSSINVRKKRKSILQLI
jgi:hypothetical protein